MFHPPPVHAIFLLPCRKSTKHLQRLQGAALAPELEPSTTEPTKYIWPCKGSISALGRVEVPCYCPVLRYIYKQLWKLQKLHLFPHKSACSLWHHSERVVTATSCSAVPEGMGQTWTPTDCGIKRDSNQNAWVIWRVMTRKTLKLGKYSPVKDRHCSHGAGTIRDIIYSGKTKATINLTHKKVSVLLAG